MPHWEFVAGMCSIVYTAVVHFPFTFVGGVDFCRFAISYTNLIPTRSVQKQQKVSDHELREIFSKTLCKNGLR